MNIPGGPHNLLPTPTISTRHFTYTPDHGFSAEASDLRDHLRLGQVYADACDEGFTLVSARTGERMPMVRDDEIRRDGELVAEVFVPVDRAKRRNKDLHVRIYND